MFQHLTIVINSYAEQRAFLLKTSCERKVRIGGKSFEVTVTSKDLKPESCHSCLNALSNSDHLFVWGIFIPQAESEAVDELDSCILIQSTQMSNSVFF